MGQHVDLNIHKYIDIYLYVLGLVSGTAIGAGALIYGVGKEQRVCGGAVTGLRVCVSIGVAADLCTRQLNHRTAIPFLPFLSPLRPFQMPERKCTHMCRE